MATFPAAGNETSSRLLEGWTFLLVVDPELETRCVAGLEARLWLGGVATGAVAEPRTSSPVGPPRGAGSCGAAGFDVGSGLDLDDAEYTLVVAARSRCLANGGSNAVLTCTFPFTGALRISPSISPPLGLRSGLLLLVVSVSPTVPDVESDPLDVEPVGLPLPSASGLCPAAATLCSALRSMEAVLGDCPE